MHSHKFGQKWREMRRWVLVAWRVQFIQFCDTCNVQVDLLKVLSVSEREEDMEWNTHR